MSKSKNQHVVTYRDRWAVRGEGNSKVTSVQNTQQKAIEEAKKIAIHKNQKL